LLREPRALQDPDLGEPEDDDRDLEHQAHGEDERRDERDVLRCAELVIDDLAAEVDEELERAREKHEVAERHPDDEQDEREWTEGQKKAPLMRPERRVDVGVDLVQQDRHREREPTEERHAHVRREVLGRTEGDEARDARRRLQKLDDLGREEERERGRDENGECRDRQAAAELPEVLHERELFVALHR